ncbi:MAG TPA: hypothetical protein DCZ13_00500, partial [Porticoccaceae bacterium]|nr:hypothetical protein [Porticoccaceae bacterium]
TSAVAMSLCDDKRLTSKLLRRAGLQVAEQTQVGTAEHNRAFLAQHWRIVVKPARGEQGKGVIVDVRDEQAMNEAIAVAAQEDVRVIWMQLGVINHDAAEKARAAGLKVVMDRCPKIEFGRLNAELSWGGFNSRIITSKRRKVRLT